MTEDLTLETPKVSIYKKPLKVVKQGGYQIQRTFLTLMINVY